MKNLIYLVLFALCFSFTNYAQENKKPIKEKKVNYFDVLEVNGEYRKNLLVLDFFRKDSRFNYGDLSKYAEMQVKTPYRGGSYYDNERLPGRMIPYVYLDGELILGNGENRLNKIVNLRMKEVKTISTADKSTDKKIYITLMDKSKTK